MRNVLERKSNHKLHFRYIFFFENRSVYEIMWKNSVDSGRLQMTIWRIAYWIRRATNTLSKHVILIAFPLLHWLNERALVLRYMYIASLFHSCNCWSSRFHRLLINPPPPPPPAGTVYTSILVFLFNSNQCSFVFDGYRAFFPELNRSRWEVNHSPLSSAEARNECSCTSTRI